MAPARSHSIATRSVSLQARAHSKYSLLAKKPYRRVWQLLCTAASCEDVEKATAFVCCAFRMSILVGPDGNVAILAPMAEWVVANAASPTATAALHKVARTLSCVPLIRCF